MSTHGPKFEKYANLSLMSVAPTVIADGARAGEAVHAFAVEFPAATTTVTFALVRFATAWSTADGFAFFC